MNDIIKKTQKRSINFQNRYSFAVIMAQIALVYQNFLSPKKINSGNILFLW